MSAMPNRCRIVLIAPEGADQANLPARILDAADGGDVASVIVPQYALSDDDFQTLCAAVTPALQAKGIAVILAGDSRVAGRVGADGLHLECNAATLAEAVKKHDGRMVVGAGGAKTRHEAMELGEANPAYIFFGKFGYDLKPEVHPRNLGLAAWWAEMMALPCIIAAGSTMDSIADAAATGADFVAVSAAVFTGSLPPSEAVRAANALLDEKAPVFET